MIDTLVNILGGTLNILIVIAVVVAIVAIYVLAGKLIVWLIELPYRLFEALIVALGNIFHPKKCLKCGGTDLTLKNTAEESYTYEEPIIRRVKHFDPHGKETGYSEHESGTTTESANRTSHTYLCNSCKNVWTE